MITPLLGMSEADTMRITTHLLPLLQSLCTELSRTCDFFMPIIITEGDTKDAVLMLQKVTKVAFQRLEMLKLDFKPFIWFYFREIAVMGWKEAAKQQQSLTYRELDEWTRLTEVWLNDMFPAATVGGVTTRTLDVRKFRDSFRSEGQFKPTQYQELLFLRYHRLSEEVREMEHYIATHPSDFTSSAPAVLDQHSEKDLSGFTFEMEGSFVLVDQPASQEGGILPAAQGTQVGSTGQDPVNEVYSISWSLSKNRIVQVILISDPSRALYLNFSYEDWYDVLSQYQEFAFTLTGEAVPPLRFGLSPNVFHLNTWSKPTKPNTYTEAALTKVESKYKVGMVLRWPTKYAGILSSNYIKQWITTYAETASLGPLKCICCRKTPTLVFLLNVPASSQARYCCKKLMANVLFGNIDFSSDTSICQGLRGIGFNLVGCAFCGSPEMNSMAQPCCLLGGIHRLRFGKQYGPKNFQQPLYGSVQKAYVCPFEGTKCVIASAKGSAQEPGGSMEITGSLLNRPPQSASWYSAYLEQFLAPRTPVHPFSRRVFMVSPTWFRYSRLWSTPRAMAIRFHFPSPME